MLNLDIYALKEQIPDKLWLASLEVIANEALSITSISDDQASAVIKGSGAEEYHTDVFCEGGQLSTFRCECRGFEFLRRCKHAYALALFASGEPNLIPQELLRKTQAKRERANKKKQKQQIDRSLLLSYLSSLDKTELEQELFAIIDADKSLGKMWLLKAELFDQADNPNALKKRITQAMPLKYLFHYKEVDNYFHNALSILVVLLDAAKLLDSECRFSIIMEMYKRLNTVLQRIDDSGGFRFPLVDHLERELKQAFTQLPWSENKKSRWIKKYSQAPYDEFPDVRELLKC